MLTDSELALLFRDEWERSGMLLASAYRCPNADAAQHFTFLKWDYRTGMGIARALVKKGYMEMLALQGNFQKVSYRFKVSQRISNQFQIMDRQRVATGKKTISLPAKPTPANGTTSRPESVNLTGVPPRSPAPPKTS